ncbi:MAG: preprotein translocase subunit SecG [Rhodobacteraceae bacterium]|nr:preprotein translocase subunit SecG [Paracoccaceae bacterium]
MQNIVLIIHLILSLCLIGIVLMQRSEGGGLGIGGGGGGNSGRPVSGPLAKVTWVIAGAFIATSLALVIISARDAGSDSVLERGGDAVQEAPAAVSEKPLIPALEGNLLPPSATDAPATPPQAEE